MPLLVKILNELHKEDYNFFLQTNQCHLSKDQWNWVINEIIQRYKMQTFEEEEEGEVNE